MGTGGVVHAQVRAHAGRVSLRGTEASGVAACEGPRTLPDDDQQGSTTGAQSRERTAE
jgi:hypothetical protein